MGIEFKKNLVVFHDVASVEDAEVLLEWLQGKTGAKADLSACTHLHCANLQVLMAAKPSIQAWPADAPLRAWLESALVAV
ncbi:hypothetical protein [Thiorhodococcus minor]|uniref:Uncharacterized protein n=1 Tax=Thiorhodococcus minor TaxID=57489 RepID=A0A6M0K5J0_9GAMM|nr:hypothetical protein [Thiorhodococcus minor]NEV64514.1 hypothetical protein [Thiorhodococcus minor]